MLKSTIASTEEALSQDSSPSGHFPWCFMPCVLLCAGAVCFLCNHTIHLLYQWFTKEFQASGTRCCFWALAVIWDEPSNDDHVHIQIVRTIRTKPLPAAKRCDFWWFGCRRCVHQFSTLLLPKQTPTLLPLNNKISGQQTQTCNQTIRLLYYTARFLMTSNMDSRYKRSTSLAKMLLGAIMFVQTELWSNYM